MFRNKFLGMVLVAGMLMSQSVPSALAATYCDQAQFVSDLTAPDGSSFAPGASFIKTWRLKNVGTCTWSKAYAVVLAGGDGIGNPAPVNLSAEVPPGQMVDVSVTLTAPSAVGHYRALFKIANASGVQFGIGEAASDPFWSDINVVATNAVIYDFVSNAPYAQWRSGAGIIPFPGASGDSRGFAYAVNNPHLEDDSFDTAPGLLLVPQNKFNGYIQATFPEFQIQQGDRLQTLVNCEFGATGCYVTFRIDYLLSNGVQRTLWSWKEAHDKRFYRADIDLSPLAGQNVRFVFMLLSTGFASGDRALWGAPRIVRSGSTQPPVPPATLTPLPPLPATATPIGQPPPTIVPSGCEKAAFVADATVPDGTLFAPGAAFTKTWRLRNIGSCPWTTSYKLVYYSGEPMSAPTAVNLPWNVGFDQTVDISVNMTAPNVAGKYRGFWILANANGQYFGIGRDATQPIWVEINVAGGAPQNTGYDFTANVCSAEWRSTVGVLPCPGADGSASGFVIRLDAPKLEEGSTGAPGLLTVPQNRYNGYIQGFYPTFTVQPGDRFQATVGCEYGAACSLTYRLDYMTASGYIGTFWTWREQNEGRVYNADLDLTPLVGRNVRFILTILATGTAANDRAVWGAPRIVRPGGSPAPATMTVNPSTTTPSPTPVNDWLKYTNPAYSFEFRYPPQAQIVNQSSNSVKMNLPFTPGTNLTEKYLETIVRENVNPCRSPVAESSILKTSETVVINGIPFLKETGGDAGAGNMYDWVAYSTTRDNACISMDFVLHSLNGFATPPPVFDRAAESVLFTQMMTTFAWIDLPLTATATQIPGSLLPDLTIAQARIELQNPVCLSPENPTGVRIWVSNNGEAAAGSFIVQVNGVDQTIDGLASGETKDVFFTQYSNPITALVDVANIVLERDETNNSWSGMLPIPTPPLPCIPSAPSETAAPPLPETLTPPPDYASHDAFCADPRIPVLIEQLKASMNQSNGNLFAGMVSPSHGVDVRLWAYSAGANLNAMSSGAVFTSTDSYNWGSGPSGIPDVGSFKDVIQPKLLEVLNAPNMETYCDTLTRVFPLANPWPYPDIRYYNLYKPASSENDFDFRTWLIGFEYVNNQPYLYGMVSIVWEP